MIVSRVLCCLEFLNVLGKRADYLGNRIKPVEHGVAVVDQVFSDLGHGCLQLDDVLVVAEVRQGILFSVFVTR